MRDRRLTQLDSLRGIAALIVLLHHTLLSAGLMTGRFRAVLVATPLRPIDNGRPAVLFFFVLSGFVLVRSLRGRPTVPGAEEYAGWVLQRTVRLCLPAAGALALSAAFYALAAGTSWPAYASWMRDVMWMRPPTPVSFLAQASLLALDGGYYLDSVLWTLVHEWRISLLLPFIATAAIFRGGRGALLLTLTGIAAGSVFGGPWGDSLGLGSTFLASLRSTLYFLLPFLIGAALEIAGAENVRAGRWHVAAGALAVLGLARTGSDDATFVASALTIWLALQPGPIQATLRHPALVWLGRISFSLYLAHLPVLALLFRLLPEELSPIPLCAACVVAALLVAQLFYVAVERPAHRIARLIGQRRRAPAEVARTPG